jgi:hypothetical protein
MGRDLDPDDRAGRFGVRERRAAVDPARAIRTDPVGP